MRAARVLAACVLAWTVLCALGAWSSYGDSLRRGDERSYGLLLWYWWSSHVLVMLLNAGLYLALSGAGPQWMRARRLLGGYAVVLAIFLPLEWLYVSWLQVLKRPPDPGWEAVWRLTWQRLHDMPKFEMFTEFAWTTFTYAAVAALVLWQRHRLRELAWQQERANNLALRLELEQQRLQALRGQLEPHFIFNALNAISALVRMDDKRVALSGIARLSDLLRYATAASTRDWVSMDEELQFVRDYLALQGLRYGERLQVAIDDGAGAMRGADSPPLLLQPLVENALRHGLDSHGGAGMVAVHLRREDGKVHIRIANSVPEASTPNPGLGIGLHNTRARLRIAYGDAALLRTWCAEGEFIAELVHPACRPEAP